MSQLWKVGLFAKDYSYFDDMFEFANKLIGSKGEVITYIEKTTRTFRIDTDKASYRFVVVNESIRGYRWHEAYIFDSWTMSKEMIDGLIIAKIVPYDIWDRDATWSYKKYVHFMERNKLKQVF